MTFFEGYLIRLTAAAILAAVVRKLAPAGAAGKAAKLGAGLLVLLTAFGPVAEIDMVAAAENIARQGFYDPLSTGELESTANTLLSGLISQEAEAYILDKAQALGLEVTVTVETKVEGRYPVPWRVTLRGSPTQGQKAALTGAIGEELGIPEERQEWLNM